MSKNVVHLRDKVNMQDSCDFIGDGKLRVLPKTQVLAGYNHYIDDNGISQLGEVIFEKENQIVLGGAVFILEKLFKLKSSVALRTLNDIMSINTGGTNAPDNYPEGRHIQLFGVGTGGSGDTINSIKPVQFYEDTIQDMVPFKLTASPLVGADQQKYFFKKEMPEYENKSAYYLKAFNSLPALKILKKNGVDGEDGAPITESPHAGSDPTPIETFVEMVLQIDKKDIREWFTATGNIDLARINSLGLFTGIKVNDDFKDVKLFSKLNIDNEMFRKLKTLTFIYRIFTS